MTRTVHSPHRNQAHRGALRRLVVLLLLVVLPFAALGGYARESAPACAMMGDSHDGMADADSASAHCERMHAPDTLPAKHSAHCSLCGDLGAPLPTVASPQREHRVAVFLAASPSDLLLLPTLAAPWRPPRAL